jgi:hypothetical protein
MLEFNLQKAGKFESPKPLMRDYEKKLITEANSNTYFKAILHMVLAMNRSNLSEQEYLL